MVALRRHLLLSIVVVVQLSTVFGFQGVMRQQPRFTGRSGQFSNAPLLTCGTTRGRVDGAFAGTELLAATPQEEQAVAEFKMITEEESLLRKIGGVGLGVVTIASFLVQGHDYGNLSIGAFAALSTYRTGAEYQ